MPPSEFSIRLQKGKYYLFTISPTKLMTELGITGGFAPPTPTLIIEAVASNNDLKISAARRSPGTPDLAREATNTVAVSDHEALVDELYGILKELPMEKPRGIEDIYGLDTSIAWQSDDLEWYNGGPQGCGGGESDVQADGEEKKNFKRAIGIIEKIAGET
jgi:hypothetical protein